MRCRRCWSDHWGCRTSPIWGRGCRGRGFSCHSIKFQLAAGSSWKLKVFIIKKLLSSWDAGIRQSLVYRRTLWTVYDVTGQNPLERPLELLGVAFHLKRPIKLQFTASDGSFQVKCPRGLFLWHHWRSIVYMSKTSFENYSLCVHPCV